VSLYDKEYAPLSKKGKPASKPAFEANAIMLVIMEIMCYPSAKSSHAPRAV